jgi:acyl dehydratase
VSDIVTGQTISAVKFGPVELAHLKAYADASGDFNSIHTDEAAAKAAGLPGIIAHGMLSSGLLAERSTQFMKQVEGWRLSCFQTRFKGMIFLGDTIELSGTVGSMTTDTIQLDLVAKNQRDEIVTLSAAEYKR